LNQQLVYKNVVAICDVDDKMLAEGRKRVEDKTKRTPATYKDYRKMLEKENLDAVLICTPDHWHAFKRLMHAPPANSFVEKPMALTISETQLMLKAARKYNVVVQNGSMQRSMSGFREACEYAPTSIWARSKWSVSVYGCKL
jgi:predicted dehydrogenase